MTTSQGFDTTRPGTPPQHWQQWTQFLPEWTPPGGPVLVVSPHPDDETLGAGGLMHLCRRQRRNVTVLALTDGEAACPEVPGLARIRRGELDAAMGALGVDSARVIRWGLPDGHLEAHESQIAEALLEVGGHFGLLVAPFERDGHPDHEAAARATRSAASILRKPLARYPIWAWHRGSRDLQGAPSAVRLLLDEDACAAKDQALAQFRSQRQERPGGAIVPEHVLAYFRADYEVFLL